MKSFRFKLDQAHRWRAAQVDVAKARAAAAVALQAGIQSRIDTRRTELATAGADVTKGGSALQLWPAWKDRCDRDIAQLEQAAKAAEQEVAKAMQQLVVANQNAQVLEKLRSTQLAHWTVEAGRELEAFAGETFLRQVTIGKRRGA